MTAALPDAILDCHFEWGARTAQVGTFVDSERLTFSANHSTR